MEAKRKLLYPIMRQMQQNPQNRVALVRDKLCVNDDLYTVHTNEAGELTLKLEKQNGGTCASTNRRSLRGGRNRDFPQPGRTPRLGIRLWHRDRLTLGHRDTLLLFLFVLRF